MELICTDDNITFRTKVAHNKILFDLRLKKKKEKKSIGKNEHNANIFSYKGGNSLNKTERNEKLELIK